MLPNQITVFSRVLKQKTLQFISNHSFRKINHHNSITMGSMRTRNIVGTLHSYGAFVTVFRFGRFARGLKWPNSGVVRCLVALPHQIRTCDIIDFQEKDFTQRMDTKM